LKKKQYLNLMQVFAREHFKCYINNIMAEDKKKNSYGAQDIMVLEGLEPVRKRPGMYIGSTGTEGLHHLIWEVFDNSLDEAMAGFAKNIELTLLPDSYIRVVDDGRGIPVEKHKQTGVSTLETVLTVLHAGGKFGGDSYKVSAGLHGVGVSVVNALSTYLKAEVRREGELFSQEYERGVPKAPVKKVGSTKEPNGTTITFRPDEEIFKDIEFNWDKILNRIRQQAYLSKGINIIVRDERKPLLIDSVGDKSEHHAVPVHRFYFEEGIVSYVKYLNRHHTVIHPTIAYFARDAENIQVEIAMQYIEDLQGTELSFANNVHTTEGGTHLTGFRTAITRTMNDYARKNGILKDKDENLTGEDLREGLTVVVSVKLREPQFEGQTKGKLGTTEARPAVEQVTNSELVDWLDRNPQEAKMILGKVILAAKARIAAKAARDTVIRKGALEGFALPGKLADCSSKNPEDSELFIVEGESAGGSSKQGRNRRTQAILPLKGKILNVEKARIDRMLASEEIRHLVIALGTAIADEFDLSKLRYHKIIIMTDADVDGAHIRTLLLTLFYRYFPKLIENGHIYIAQPPLYRIEKNKKVQYAYKEQEKDIIMAKLESEQTEKALEKAVAKKAEKKKVDDEEAQGTETESQDTGRVQGVNLQRYKGLGEMNPDQLWETTMDPEKRVLLKVTINDAEAANQIFDVLMGSEVMARKKFIQTHASSVKNLDI